MKSCLAFLLFILQGCVAAERSGCTAGGGGVCLASNVKEQCRATLEAYPYFRDRLMYKKYGELFTDNGRFQIGNGLMIEGRDKIVAALRERGPKVATHHLAQITQLNLTSDSTANAISYVNVYKVAKDQNNPSLWIIGEYHDQLSITAKGCKIESRKVKLVSRID